MLAPSFMPSHNSLPVSGNRPKLVELNACLASAPSLSNVINTLDSCTDTHSEILYSCLLSQINYCDFGDERLSKRFTKIIVTIQH